MTSFNFPPDSRVLACIQGIPPERYNYDNMRHNSGAKRKLTTRSDSYNKLSYEERYLVHLIEDLNWTYQAIADKTGTTRQMVYKQYLRIVKKCSNSPPRKRGRPKSENNLLVYQAS